MRRAIAGLFVLVLLITPPAMAQSDLATSDVVKIIEDAAGRDDYKLGQDIYLNELAFPDGKQPLEGYSAVGLYHGKELVKVYAEREATGDIVELKACAIYRYPEMLTNKRDILGLDYTPPLHADVGLDKIASELGCDRLHIVPDAGPSDKPAFAAASSLSKFSSLPNLVLGTFIPTSTMVQLGIMVAGDEGFDFAGNGLYLAEYAGRNGPEPIDGYSSIYLQFQHPLNLLMIRIATGDIIDKNTCTLYRYPNLRAFRRERMRISASHPVSVQDIADEVGCSRMKIRSKKDPPIQLEGDTIPVQ